MKFLPTRRNRALDAPQEALLPFVSVDPESGQKRIAIETLPESLRLAILTVDPDSMPNGWHGLQNFTYDAHHLSRRVEEGNEWAAARLTRPEKWAFPMPDNWGDFVDVHLQLNPSSEADVVITT